MSDLAGAQVKAVFEVPNGCLLPRLIDATLPEQLLAEGGGVSKARRGEHVHDGRHVSTDSRVLCELPSPGRTLTPAQVAARAAELGLRCAHAG